jgi:hypothetical protein
MLYRELSSYFAGVRPRSISKYSLRNLNQINEQQTSYESSDYLTPNNLYIYILTDWLILTYLLTCWHPPSHWYASYLFCSLLLLLCDFVGRGRLCSKINVECDATRWRPDYLLLIDNKGKQAANGISRCPILCVAKRKSAKRARNNLSTSREIETSRRCPNTDTRERCGTARARP